MKTITKLGPYKVQLDSKKPFPAALEFLSGPNAILPSGIWSTAKEDAEGKFDYATVKPIGTGSYKITKAVPCDSVIMEINKDQMEGSLKGKLLIGKLVFRMTGDTERQMVELLTGGLIGFGKLVKITLKT